MNAFRPVMLAVAAVVRPKPLCLRGSQSPSPSNPYNAFRSPFMLTSGSETRTRPAGSATLVPNEGDPNGPRWDCPSSWSTLRRRCGRSAGPDYPGIGQVTHVENRTVLSKGVPGVQMPALDHYMEGSVDLPTTRPVEARVRWAEQSRLRTRRRVSGNTRRPLMRWILFALALVACEDGPTTGPTPEPPLVPRVSDIKLPDLILGVGNAVVILDVSVLFTGDPFTFSASSSDTTVVAVLLTPPPFERSPSYRLTISALAPGVAEVRVQADGYEGSWAAQTSHVTVIPR